MSDYGSTSTTSRSDGSRWRVLGPLLALLCLGLIAWLILVGTAGVYPASNSTTTVTATVTAATTVSGPTTTVTASAPAAAPPSGPTGAPSASTVTVTATVPAQAVTTTTTVEVTPSITPKGHVSAGGGSTATGTSTPLVLAGGLLLMLSALPLGWATRRRRQARSGAPRR
jgi:LPXTG-motif cell wall-anchored protein